MATLLQPTVGKTRTPSRNVKIDMTPMVDLGFLLITFFIFTASLTQPTVTKLTMPKKGEGTMDVYEKILLTAVLHKDAVLVYEGGFEKAVNQNKVQRTTYDVKSGLGRFIRQKQASLNREGLKEELLVVIKPMASASYQNVVSALDEMHINNVGRYAVVDVSENERAYLAAKPLRR